MKAYLLYRPVIDYEESLDPIAIFTSKRKAELACRRIQEWGQRVFDTMPPLSDDKTEADYAAREKHLSNAGKAPYSWLFTISDLSAYNDRYAPESVAVVALDLNPTP